MMNNILGSLTFCHYCGYPMLYKNIGTKQRSHQYLECGKARLGLSCEGKRVQYGIVENSILTYCKELNVSDIIGSDTNTKTALSELQHKLQSIEGELTDVEKRYKSIIDSMEITDNAILKQDLNERASQLLERRDQLRTDKKETHSSIDKLLSTEKNTRVHLESIKALIELMNRLEGQERVNLRLNLRSQLRRLISRIEIHTSAIMIIFNSGLNRFLSFSTPPGGRIIVQEWEN